MKKCLVVVDYQNDFVDGALGFEGAKNLDHVISEKIEMYLNNGQDLIYTLDTHYDNYLSTDEGRRLPIIHCVKGTPGHNVYGKTANYLNKAIKVFEKQTFGSLELGEFLKKQAYTSIEFVGLVTNMCVLSNVIIAKTALKDAKIIVDSKACDSFDKKLHNETLDVLKGIHIDVV